ncbi:ADP-ribosylation factor-like protein 6-interacting protein 4 [Achroia grisella]|uniref:ADP-ribosylation factor-like protein 6-interacting protein 4 n=1 Tax=Achroia grisella TaxID=688607 RepID=UPI0027D224F7|nr:ADP-ribosylation factor-like protein 6-interacting protein 4 [Achroia grisella]XP_059058591.1 ADP-ribosylation factor-like protein 6-interacting protein 4 [Achroia grisella]
MGKEKRKKRKRSTSDNDSSSSSSDSSQEKKKLRKLKKKLKKERKKTEKALKRKLKDERKKLKKRRSIKSPSRSRSEDLNKTDEPPADIPLELMEKSKAMAPMTKEEWEQRQSVVRRVLDEETGRHRLIKGDGEVLEEIVSRDRHRQINKQATQADGEFFQSQTVKKRF